MTTVPPALVAVSAVTVSGSVVSGVKRSLSWTRKRTELEFPCAAKVSGNSRRRIVLSDHKTSTVAVLVPPVPLEMV